MSTGEPGSPAGAPEFRFLPGIAGNAWPAIPHPAVARAVALLSQLEHSQWWPSERLAQMQFRQLARVVEHAAQFVPAYREPLAGVLAAARAGTLGPDDWARVPLLTRPRAQALGNDLHAESIPESHAPFTWLSTSGSTGVPLKVCTTSVTRLMFDAISLREHRWHRRDASLKLGVIRFLGDEAERGPEGVRRPTWGPPIDQVMETGPMAALHIGNDVATQLEWLERERPRILITYPSNAAELVREAARRGRTLPALDELRLFSEVLDDETRALLRDAFGARVTDNYSANEVGYVALRCAEHGSYHVQCENVIVEVLDERGRACAPGETGRVVLTTLHSLASPMLRYENGDHARVGAPCPCGRGSPVLACVHGRTRGMVVLPDGRRHWPVMGFPRFREIAPIVQHQIVQHGLDDVEVRLVSERPVTRDEEAKLAEFVHRALKHPFPLRFSYVERVERSPVGKYEEFKSLVT